MSNVSTLSSLKRVRSNSPAPNGNGTAHGRAAHPAASGIKGLVLPREPEPAGAPVQRGFISSGRAEVARLQLWLADANHPLVDARLPDGSRVNAVLRPCALDGPTSPSASSPAIS